MKPFFMAAALIVCLLPGQAAAQGVKDLFKGVQKALEQKADEQITQKVESPCIEKEDVARADTIDRDRQGTWVVETADGRRFQVADLAISGLVQDGSSFAMYLSLAEAATFGFVSQERFTKTYRVHLDYAPAADGGGGVRATQHFEPHFLLPIVPR